MKAEKTYQGKTLAEIKKDFPGCTVRYGRYRGFGDFGVTLFTNNNEELFFADDCALTDRYVKARSNNYTGTISNIDYSCEVFINGESFGTTSKHRAAVFFKLMAQGIEVESSYLSSTRDINCFLNPSEKDLKKTEINALVHSIIDGGGAEGHRRRNEIRRYAYLFGIEKAKEKYSAK